MRKWKWLIICTFSLITLVIIGALVWLNQLQDKVTVGLQTKKFLAPTEYYSAPLSLHAKLNLKQADVVRLLDQRQYRRRGMDQKLFAGDYAAGTREECIQLLPSGYPENGTACLMFMIKETADPLLKDKNLQMLVFSEADEILSSFQGNPLLLSPAAELEPELFAQYLGNEPIQQSYTPLGEIPTSCLNAVIAIEDSRFLEHAGVSVFGITRAMLANFFGRRAAQGGSTITQQLVKNYFLTPEKTIKRKATEFFMSLILETQASKDQILETYLNIIYLGQNGPFQIRGFPAAADYYFNKKIQSLELHECALLAAVLNSPGMYDPFKKQESALKRRGLVLDRMVQVGLISEDEKNAAQKLALPNTKKPELYETAPYYLDVVSKQLQKLGIDSSEKKIFTGLNIQAQASAQQAVRDQLNKLESENKKIKALKEKGKNLEGVLVSADNDTGLIHSIVGGRSFRLTQFNRAADAHRQIGSIMKPLVFLAALEKSNSSEKYTPMTILDDRKFVYEYEGQKWSPDNFAKKYFGDVPMYFALKHSLNSATASLGLKVGLENVMDVAQKAGISSRLEKVPSLTLGAFELYPLEVLQVYVTLARMGEKIPLTTVRAVLDANGKQLYHHESVSQRTLSAAATASLISMMKQTVESGSARSIVLSGFNYPAAGKTGTTSDNKDSWFAGFTPLKTTVAWVGYDDNTSHGLTGSSGAVPIWLADMRKQTEQDRPVDFSWPNEGVYITTINQLIDEPKPFDLVFKDDNQ